MREQNTLEIANIYEATAKALSFENEQRKYQKVYNNLNNMLQECYFVGATKFGNNFIA